MTVLSVPDMHCETCVKRITAALQEAGLQFSVSLADKTVTVDGGELLLKTAISELEDLGFSATAV
jgi:copper chaperone